MHRLDDRQERNALVMAQAHGVPELVARILAARGIEPAGVERFLDPTIRDLLPDPARLTDADAAAARLAEAIVRREQVAIFGDYDVDGAASSALLQRFLTAFGVTSEIYIPDRIFEGYGPNPEAMRDLVARGARLIVTVDCGTNSAPSIAAAREAGADVVVIDHHQVGGALPAGVAVVNPNREDDLSGQGHLCAAGVVFLVLVQTARRLRTARPDLPPPDLLALLDLVGLATVCDVVPLVGVNRAFVVKGLLAMRRQVNPGLAALARLSRIGEPINTFHLGFLIGPRINAGGRIGDAALGSRLLSTDDPVEAGRIAEVLDGLNAERQAMEQSMLAEARAEADAELAVGEGPAIVVTASDGWHPGIVGLLASRLKDHARRPAFAIAFNGVGVGTGSGRSIPGFDLGRLVRGAHDAGLIEKGGGHAMAAGLTIRRERLGDLRAYFESHAARQVADLRDAAGIEIDAAVVADGLTPALLDSLDQAGPFGAGYPQPMLALPRHLVTDVRQVGTGHLRVDLRSDLGGSTQAMAFRASGTAIGDELMRSRGRRLHVAGQVQSNYWNGTRRAQFRIVDVAQVNTV